VRTLGSRLADERGQTTTEYLMIAGLLTAIIVSLTKIIVPTMAWVVVKLVNQMAIGISSV
jgi:Flp pilus assembly pilin Flp